MEIFESISMAVWGWLIFAVAMLIIEGMTVALVSIWFAAGGLAASVTAFITDRFIVQLLVFAVVTLLLALFTRPVAARKLNSRIHRTNLDVLIGREAVVTKDISRLEFGEVKAGGKIWTAALGEDLPYAAEGEIVKIEAIQGVKLIVGRR